MMIKFGTSPVPLTHSADSHNHLESTGRLVVLVPAQIDFNVATQRIWALAQTSGMQIQLLGLSKDALEESRLRRELITMASLLRNGKICAEAQVVIGTNWVEALKPTYKTGDMIVCFAEQRTGLLQKPLNQILESSFNATVYILAGLAAPNHKSNRLARVSTWVGVVGIIAGFGILQTKIVQLPAGWFQNTLLILSLILEFWLIWVWDSWFR
jgi:hypothetical protein